MKRYFFFVTLLVLVGPLLFAAEWLWETKGFPFQRIKIGEEGIWREIPSYVDTCFSIHAPLGTTLSVQWAGKEGAWLEDLEEIVEDSDLIPVISAAEYVDRKQESQKTTSKKKASRFRKSIGLSVGYGSRLIGIYRNSLVSPSSLGFPRISLPDVITIGVNGETSYKINSWNVAFSLGLREMIEPSPMYASLMDSEESGFIYSLNPHLGLGVAYQLNKTEIKTVLELGYSVLSQAFADNAHTGDVMDIGIGKFSTSSTFGGVIEVVIPFSDKIALGIKERLLLYYPSMYLHIETLMIARVHI